jgi:hypothetical protein
MTGERLLTRKNRQEPESPRQSLHRQATHGQLHRAFLNVLDTADRIASQENDGSRPMSRDGVAPSSRRQNASTSKPRFGSALHGHIPKIVIRSSTRIVQSLSITLLWDTVIMCLPNV